MILKTVGFEQREAWSFNVEKEIRVFKIKIDEIIPEQLTVDSEKLDKVNTWLKTPEQVIVNCVNINDKTVCIDGYSRLVAAHNKGFKHVYGYVDPEDTNHEFYKTCLSWCEEQNVKTIADLAKRVVTPEEHQEIWINRCQAYFQSQ